MKICLKRKSASNEKLLLDFARDIRLCAVMDDAQDLAMKLVSVAGAMLEEAASLAPLSDKAGLGGRIDTIERKLLDALPIVAAAKVLVARGETLPEAQGNQVGP